MTVSDTLSFRRILVSGSEGFVGTHLLPALASRLAPQGRLFAGVRAQQVVAPDQIHCDVLNPTSVSAAVERSRPDLLIHLAAQSSVGKSGAAAGATWAVNVAGSLNLAMAVAAIVPDCTVLFASSAEVYGATFNEGTATEDSILRPRSPYARSKAAAEQLLADVLPSTCRLITARPANHTGAGQSCDFVVPAFAGQIARVEGEDGATIHVGELESRRDFLDVADVVDAYLALLAAAPTLPLRSVFNIAAGQTVRIGDLLDSLLTLAARQISVERDPARLRPSEIAVAAISSAALQALGWAPARPLDLTLATVLEEQRQRVAAAPSPGPA